MHGPAAVLLSGSARPVTRRRHAAGARTRCAWHDARLMGGVSGHGGIEERLTVVEVAENDVLVLLRKRVGGHPQIFACTPCSHGGRRRCVARSDSVRGGQPGVTARAGPASVWEPPHQHNTRNLGYHGAILAHQGVLATVSGKMFHRLWLVLFSPFPAQRVPVSRVPAIEGTQTVRRGPKGALDGGRSTKRARRTWVIETLCLRARECSSRAREEKGSYTGHPSSHSCLSLCHHTNSNTNSMLLPTPTSGP